MILVSPIPIVVSVGAVVITNVAVGKTLVTPMIGITLLIVMTIVTCVLGCAMVVSRTWIVAMISIAIWRLTGNSPIEIVSSGRVTSISRVVLLILILTLISIVVSMVVIARSWRWRMGWVIQMSSIGLSAAVVCILGLTTVHSVASIIVAWGASTTKLILIIVVVRVAVIVTITTGVHGPPGLVKLLWGLTNRRCGEPCG